MFGPRSLRTRLILAFTAVMVLSLFLTSGAFTYLLREYQVDREKDRLESLALSTTGQVVQAIRRGIPKAELDSQLQDFAQQQRVRILLLDDRGVIVRDTEDNHLVDRVLVIPQLGPARRPGVVQGAITTPSGDTVYAVLPQAPPGVYRVALIASEQSLTTAWRDLLPRLAFAVLSSLAVSIALGWWLASTITRPVSQITRASEEMARGNYAQEIPVANNGDEISRLARSFNGMAREVDRSHRAMRDLLANVSHDLRTPLTSIQGFSGALVDGTLRTGDGAREAGRVIGEEAERMRRLVEDLIYLGRIESGELRIDRQPVDLSDLVEAAKHRFIFRSEQEGVELRTQLPSDFRATGDAHRLAQVLDNLLDNAFKHSPPTGVVTVSGSVSGSEAIISVHNTGSYIPPDEIGRVLERFYQVDKARARNSGRGLGLAIANEIVQAHGGRITADSGEAEGTTFRVHLPVLGETQEPNIKSRRTGRRPAITSEAA